MTDEITVGIVGDAPHVARAARALWHSGFQVVAEATETDEFLQRCADRPPHVAVVATRAPAEGPVALRRLAAGMPRTRLVAIVPTTDRALVRAALAAGADGIVTIVQIADALPVIVHSVWLGQTCIPRATADAFECAALSHREQEVLDLVGAGLSNAQIAGRLCVTEHTVKSHLTKLFSKLGVHSRTEAIAVHTERSRSRDAGPHAQPAPSHITHGALA